LAIFISSRVPVPENNLTWFVGPAMRAMVPLLVVAVRKTLPSRNDTSIPRFSPEIGSDTAKTRNSFSLSLSIGCSPAYLSLDFLGLELLNFAKKFFQILFVIYLRGKPFIRMQ